MERIPIEDDDAWITELRRRATEVLTGEANLEPWPVVRDALLTELRVRCPTAPAPSVSRRNR